LWKSPRQRRRIERLYAEDFALIEGLRARPAESIRAAPRIVDDVDIATAAAE
jgi:hypothetical protein